MYLFSCLLFLAGGEAAAGLKVGPCPLRLGVLSMFELCMFMWVLNHELYVQVGYTMHPSTTYTQPRMFEARRLDLRLGSNEREIWKISPAGKPIVESECRYRCTEILDLLLMHDAKKKGS
ncbi:hypothetical protein F5Y05DRAFT_370881 [Hypoxylon sp. FL0543]|nr:hypothetical protein F5Y05DRAFT_370881 [Hypoxylon sp. FL0543]